MKLAKSVELGVKVVNVLRGRGEQLSAVTLATEVGTTTNFLSPVLRKLSTAGVISAKRGPGGGYSLDSTKVVTAYDVASAVTSDFAFTTDTTTVTGRLSSVLSEAFMNTTL